MIITRTDPATQPTYEPQQVNPFTEHRQKQIFEDLLEQRHTLEERDSQHLERIAELEEENERLRGQRCAHCQETEQERDRERKRATLYRDLHYQTSEEYRLFKEWIRDLWRNRTVPVGCKVTFLWLYMLLTSMRNPIIDQEQQITLGEIAEACSENYGTVSKHLAQFVKHDVILRREDEEAKQNKEDPKTIYYWTPQEIMMHPADIDLNKKEHGGKTKKGCSKDGTVLNRYTVTHCPTHGEIGLYDQPGTPKEADDTLMIDDFIRKYENRVPHALANYRNPVTGQLESQEQNLCSNAQRSLSPDSTEAPSSVLSATPIVGRSTTLSELSPSTGNATKPAPQEAEETRATLEQDGTKSHENNTPTISTNQKQDAFSHQDDHQPEQLAEHQPDESEPPDNELSGQALDQAHTIEAIVTIDPAIRATRTSIPAWIKEQPDQEPQDQDETQPIAEIRSQEPEKQDAFSVSGSSSQDSDPTDLNVAQHAARNTTPATATHGQEQPERNQLDAQHIPPLVRQVVTEAKPAVCRAVTPLNAKGQPAKACNEHGHPDKIVSGQECGCTQFFWDQDERAYLCRACFTPLPPPAWRKE